MQSVLEKVLETFFENTLTQDKYEQHFDKCLKYNLSNDKETEKVQTEEKGYQTIKM